MERSKLDHLIRDKNERLERDTLRSAEDIIDSISKEKARIADSEKRIVELREQLKALTVPQLDAAELLGGE